MPGVARATFLFYYGLKPGRFPRLNLSTFNLGVTFQLCSHPRSLYPQRKPVISCNKAWKNSKGALKVPRTDMEKAGASRVKAQRGSILGSTVPRAKIQTKPLVPGDSRQKETHRPSVTRTEWGSGGSGCHPVREAGRRLRSAPTRWAKRGGGCSVAGRSTQPLLPGPSLPPSPRPGLSRLLFPCFASLPPLPPPTPQNEAPSPPKPTNFPIPPLLPTSQEHAETAGQEAPQDGPHLPFSRSLLSPARGSPKRGRRGAGAAAAAAGLHAHASQLSRERRKKGARQGSARAAAAAAALSIAPLRPGLARRQRLLPCRRLLPRRPAAPAQLLIQPLPLTQRRRDIPPAACTSRRRGLPARRRAPSLGAASRALQKRRGGRAHGLGWETPGDLRGEQRRAGGERPPGGAFQWDSFPGRPLRPSPRRA